MKLLLALGLVGALALWPFIALKRPWALRLWGRVKLILVVYVLVLVVATVLRLAFGWHDIYG
jgi:energy-converting hydrogenase Eha subunit H